MAIGRDKYSDSSCNKIVKSYFKKRTPVQFDRYQQL